MSIVDKIIMLLEQKDKSQKELTDYLGLEKSTFSAWKSGKSKSYSKYISKIAEFLNVPINFLLEIGVFSNWDMIYKNRKKIVNLIEEVELFEPSALDLLDPENMFLFVNIIDATIDRFEFRGEDIDIYIKGVYEDLSKNLTQNSSIKCSNEEIYRIKKYRSLDRYGKKAVDDLLNTEYERCTTQTIEPNQESTE